MSEQINEQNIKSLNMLEIGKKLWPFVQPYKGRVWGLITIILLGTLASRAFPFLIGMAVDNGIEKKDLQFIHYIALVYFILVVADLSLSYFRTFLMAKLGNRVMHDIRRKVISKTQTFPLTFFDNTPTGKVVTRVTNDILSLGNLFNVGIAGIVINAFQVLTIIASLAIISWKLTALTLIAVPVLIYFANKVSIRLRASFKSAKKQLSEINAYNVETLSGIKTIQLFNRAEEKRQSFHKKAFKYKDLQIETVKNFALLWPLIGLFRMVTLATALLVGGIYYKEWGISIGLLSSFLLLIHSFFPPLRNILERINQFQDSLASCDRVFELINECSEDDGSQSINAENFKGVIEFKNLRFKYNEETDDILKGLNFKINPKESIAIVGRTGSGKSTIISLLQKLYSYKDGNILIDGIELNDLNNKSLRNLLAVVQQDNFIFKGDIRSNITLYNDKSDEELKLVTQLSQCDQIIAKRTDGLSAKVEERGANLSAGEKQLIAIARALAFDPKVLILDEATANIDSHNEELIQKATEHIIKGRTSIIIAHRLSTILNCDRIMVLDQGEIVEFDSFKNLMANSEGHFYNLYKKHFYSSEINVMDDHSNPSPTL